VRRHLVNRLRLGRVGHSVQWYFSPAAPLIPWLSHDGCMRKWRWRGAGIAVGVFVAAAFAIAGQWRGGLVGAVLIGVGSYVAPEVSAWLSDRRTREGDRRRTERAGLAVLDQVSGPAAVQPAEARGSAAWWLRPDQRVVDFVDRPELGVLREWCADEHASGMVLLTGAGGVGKTRLALRLAEEQQEAGWLCRLVRPGGEANVVDATRAVSLGPALLVVDYAETRSNLAELLRKAAVDTGGRLRIVLLARGQGEWWAQLEAFPDDDVRRLVAAAKLVPVGSGVGQAASGADLIRAAVPEFARALGTAVPDLVEVQIPAAPVPILVLHAAALLAVMDARDHPREGPVRVVAEEVLAGLLLREKTFWLGSARTAGLTGPDGIDSVVAAQAVAVACLLPVADETEATRALRRVPGLADAPTGTLRRIARWLAELYPADRPDSAMSSRWWGYMQPDLLAEYHVVCQLVDAPELAGTCLRDLTAEQAHGALTVLARACAHRDQAPALIETALRADLSTLGVPAVAVALQTESELSRVLANMFADADVPKVTLTEIEAAIPYPTVVLAEADVILTRRIIQTLSGDVDRAEIAMWRIRLGYRLHQAGRWHDALPVTEDAVTTYRELAAVNPDRYRPELADALTSLGIRLYELGRHADALPAAQESVDLRRELAAADPDRHRPGLADSLNSFGVRLAALGRYADALRITQESVAVYRELANAYPDCYRHELALLLNNLGVRLSALGRDADALTAARESVAIRRELVARSPDRYRPGLAVSLNGLGVRLAALGHYAEALLPVEESVDIRRELAAINPDRYRSGFADSLNSLGIRLAALGRHAEALPITQESVDIRRELAAIIPERYQPGLAASLDNLSTILSALGRTAEADNARAEAATIC
jgi:tetratricopeptide (TPR) repeat protein